MNPTTQKRLIKEIESFLDALKSEGIDYSVSFIFPGKGKHCGMERISVKDDHHMLDLINNQLQAWTFLNHPEKNK